MSRTGAQEWSGSWRESKWLQSCLIKWTHSWELSFHGKWSKESAWGCGALGGDDVAVMGIGRTYKLKPPDSCLLKDEDPRGGKGAEGKKMWASPQRNTFQELIPRRFPFPGDQRQLSLNYFLLVSGLAPSCKQGRIESDFLLDLFLSLYFCSRWLLLDRMLCIAVPYIMACLGNPARLWMTAKKKKLTHPVPDADQASR